MKCIKKSFIHFIILIIIFSLVQSSNLQTVFAQESSESEAESVVESADPLPEDLAGSEEIAQEESNQPPISESKLNLLKEFPFESIVGFSWPLYSERPLNEIYTESSAKVGAIYTGKTAANQEPTTYKVIANGFFISADGYFLTTYHRMKDVFDERNLIDSTIELKLQTHHSLKLIDLTLVKSDPEGDLIIFQADLEQLGLSEVPFVEFSQFLPTLGQPVFGIGFPDILAVEGGLYPGFITEIGTTEVLDSGYGLTKIVSSGLIPSTANGCLIVNSGGQAIGISSTGGIRSISDRYSIFYTSNQIVNRLDYLLSGDAEQSMVWTGMTLLSDSDYARLVQTFDLPNGCFVTDVFIDGPAYVSDIRKDDIILSVNDQTINSGSEFRELLINHQMDDALEIKIYRPNLDKEYVRTLYLDFK